jgi:hypothetical protein
MAITSDDLQDFNRFVVVKLEIGEADSLVELANQWEANRRQESQAVPPLDAASLSALAAAFPEEYDISELNRALSRRDGVTTSEMLRNAATAAEQTNQG